jgi:glycosyltransferase involved in cell wall biosynthesis
MRRSVSMILTNDLSGGGAQNGLAHILAQGFLGQGERHLVAIVRGDGAVESRLAAIPNLTVAVLSPSPRMRLGHLLKAFAVFPWLVLKHRPRVVIGSLPQANLVVRAWAHVLPFRCYSFEHNTRYAKGAYAPLLKLLSRPVRGLLADCQATIDAVLRHFIRPGRLTHHVVPLVAVSPPRKPPDYTRKAPLRLVSASRLTPVKNHAAVIDAMALLRKQGIPATFTVFGVGPLREQLEAQAKGLGLASSVLFKGYRADWQQTLAAFDVYVQPSLHEGLGISLITAMNAGLPCAATATGGIAEYGTSGKTYLAAGTDAASLAAALASLAASPARRAALGRAGAREVRKRFNPKTVKAQLAAVGKKLLSA